MLSPNHERASGNKAFYEKELAKEAEEKADKMLRGDDGSPGLDKDIPNNEASATGAYTSYERQMYEKLCRGEVGPELKQLAELKCRYVTENSPFLTIAPLKLEEASLNPYIVVYHDVIYDDEIEFVKQMAKPRVSHSFTGHKVNDIYESLMSLFPHFSSVVQPFKITKPVNWKLPVTVLASQPG